MAQSPVFSFISRLEKRERIILYVTAVIVSLMLLDRFVVSQILSKMSQLDRKIESQEELIRNSFIITTQEKRILKEIREYDPYFNVPESEEKENTAFLKEVENYAKDSSVYLVDIKPSGKKEMGASKQYFLKLEFEAIMDQVLNFFYIIENSRKLLRIEGYQLSPKTEGSSIMTCSVSVSKTMIYK